MKSHLCTPNVLPRGNNVFHIFKCPNDILNEFLRHKSLSDSNQMPLIKISMCVANLLAQGANLAKTFGDLSELVKN